MLSFGPSRLLSRVLPLAIFLAAAQLHAANVIYQFLLPTADINNPPPLPAKP
jgi:hypothetical protein